MPASRSRDPRRARAKFSRRLAGAILAGLAAAVSAVAASGQESPPVRGARGASFAVSPAASRIRVDGALDEEAWARAAVIPLLFEWTPGDNVPPPVATECLVTYGTDRIYIGFRAYDPAPAKIRAHLMDRDATDALIRDDHIVVFLDPFNDERRGFQFRVNPLGVQADAMFSELEGYEDFSWDAIWDSAGRIGPDGYTIEMAIPFAQLRFPSSEAPATWGFGAERSWPRDVRHRITSHRRDRSIACLLCQLNGLDGLRGMTAGRNLELDPTLTARRTDLRAAPPAGPMDAGPVTADPGLSLRWSPTPNLALNAAANPDFSQVEADVAQLDVNTRFALYYPEKRPFFLEGADVFLTPIQAVFTRTVADPAGGVKFTGKAGRNAFGFFGTYDRINNLLLPSNQGTTFAFLDDDVTAGVFRYRRDVGRSSTVGALYAGRSGDGYFNHVAGADAFLRFSPTTSFSLQYLHSETGDPASVAALAGRTERRSGGDAAYATMLHMSRGWTAFLTGGLLTKGFRADSGFLPQVDVRSVQAQVQRNFWGRPGGWFDRLGIGFSGERSDSMDGRLTGQSTDLTLYYQGVLQTRVQASAGAAREYYLGRIYDLARAIVRAETKPVGGFAFILNGRIGDTVDYANARKSAGLTVSPGLELDFGRHVSLGLSESFERLAWRGDDVYRINLTQIRLVYNFSVRTFLRVIVQYRDLARDPSLYTVPVAATTKTVFSQVLFSYKLNPQTVLFLGYSDDYLGSERADLARTGRTFFFKIGYAWLR